MSEFRNEQRVPEPESLSKEESNVAHQQEDVNAGNISFPVLTDMVKLPSKGRYYSPGHEYFNKEEVEMLHPTAKSSDILNNKSYIKNGTVFDKFLQSLLTGWIKQNVDSLLIGDKTAMLIQARINGYEPAYEVNYTCPSCTKTQEVSFALEECTHLFFTECPEDTPSFINHKHGKFSFQLPKSKVTVKVKLLTVKDELELEKLAKTRAKNKLQESSVTDALRKMIVSVNGHEEPKIKNEFINRMPLEDLRYLNKIYYKLAPRAEIKGEFSCGNCGFERVVDVPIDVEFFWPKR